MNPQILHFAIMESAPNTFTCYEWRLPIMKVGTKSDRAQTMELIKIFTIGNIPDCAVLPGAPAHVRIGMKWGGEPAAWPAFADPTQILLDWSASECTDTGAAGGHSAFAGSVRHCLDFTDGAGHGMILFVDRVWVYIEGAGNTNAKSVIVQLYFRFKNVGIYEFLSGLTAQHG